VRRLSRWIVGVASALAIWRLWTRRRRGQEPPATGGPDPADELRRKLAETRDTESGDGQPAEQDESLDERRARVHAKAQEAMEAMREEQP
jgi:hypothetical protein